MIYRIARISLVVILVTTLIIPPPPAFACGPYFPLTIFIQTKHPDLPLAKYAAGDLGVVQPSYARSYLVVAYRYVSGGTFSSSEQKQLVDLWAHRLGHEKEWLGKEEMYAPVKWLETRRKVTAKKNPDYMDEKETTFPNWAPNSSQYSNFENCSDDAFLTAAHTLESRAKSFGPRSEAVQSWVEAQDAVFHNCGDPNQTADQPHLPPDSAKTLPPLLRADREYQVAASYFYVRNWEEAERRFLRISDDPASPWKRTAAIVAVRCQLRKDLLGDADPRTAVQELAAADARLLKLEADPAMREFRPAIWRMRGYVEFRLNPQKRFNELARTIENGANKMNLRQDLDDYTQLLDREIVDYPLGDQDYVPPGKIPKLFDKTSQVRKYSAMTDWIFTYQASGDAAAAHALAKWKESHSPAWFVAALSKAHQNFPELAELLDSAERTPVGSSAYLTASFHRARLLAEMGKDDQARQVADSALQLAPEHMPASARNLFLALRMKLARNLDEFLEFAPRSSSLITSGEDVFAVEDPLDWCMYGNADHQAACKARKPSPLLFDADASTMLTQGIPTTLLSQAAKSERLPSRLRKQVAQLAWVRAVLLGDEQTARGLAPMVSVLAPDLSPKLANYDSAETSEARRFAAVFLILHRPELHPDIPAGIGRETPPGKIDSYRDNWWCSFGPKGPDDYSYNYYTMSSEFSSSYPLLELYATRKSYSPSFLSASEAAAAEKEWNQLVALDQAPVWLGKQTLAYAKAHPDDPRVPEALHLVVRATRYACTYNDPGNMSKSAFTLLHKRYPMSEWTAKTAFWY